MMDVVCLRMCLVVVFCMFDCLCLCFVCLSV